MAAQPRERGLPHNYFLLDFACKRVLLNGVKSYPGFRDYATLNPGSTDYFVGAEFASGAAGATVVVVVVVVAAGTSGVEAGIVGACIVAGTAALVPEEGIGMLLPGAVVVVVVVVSVPVEPSIETGAA